ncbi:MAG TPA: hypothetical protein VFT01_03915, partial [Homoserinimonas sp.]|nr:hypothetical protein [Homoserinimonas sp.]
MRRSAIVWGSAFALATGCVAAWGVSNPPAEQNTAGSSASQAENNGHGSTAGDGGWQDGLGGHDEPQGDDTSTDDGTPDGTPGTDDGEQDGQADTDQGAQDETPGTTTPAPAPVEPAPAPAPAPAQTGGWPTASSTGVPAGVTLTPMNGYTVTTNGAVIDAKLVKGDIVINANNVTIKNSKVEGRIQIRPPYTGLMVQSTEIAGPGTAWAAVTEGIGYANFTCDRCDIHGWGKGAMMDANVTISNS